MADDIRLRIGITGTEKVIDATNRTLGLESSVKKLSSAYARDGLTYGKYRKGLGELAAAFGRSEAELRKYANALRAADAESKKSKAATDAEIASLKAYRQARREATEENRRFNAEAKNASKAASDAVKATLEAEIAALKAYRQARREATEENRRFNLEAKNASKAASDAVKATLEAEIAALKAYRQARREATEENRRFNLEARNTAAAAKEAANAARSQADANRRLRMEFKEGYAAQVQLRAAQMRLSEALRRGIITTQEYQNQLQRLNDTVREGGRRMSSSGVLVQQTGYQVGDFIVQLQGGTNAFVAFGQQATQMAGTLTMLGGKWVLIGSILGVTIPLITALGAALVRTKVSADTVYEKFGFLEGSVRGLSAAFIGFGNVILNVLSTILKNLDVFVTILGVTAVAAVIRFVAATSAMGTIITATQLLFSGLAGAQLVAASATATLQAAMTRLMVVISAHPIIAAMTVALAAAVLIFYKARDASKEYKSKIEGLSEALKELREEAKKSAAEVSRIKLGADTNEQALAMQRILELNKLIADQQKKIAEANVESIVFIQDRIDLLEKERTEIQGLLDADSKRTGDLAKVEAKSSLDSIISSYDKQYAIQLDINTAQENMNKAVALGLIDHERMVEVMAKYTANLQGANVEREKALKISEAITAQDREYQNFLNERFVANESITKELLNQIVLNAKALQYGKDSAEYKKAEAAQAKAAFEAELRKTNLTGVQIENAMSLYNLANDTSSVLASSEGNAKGLAAALREAASAMSALSGIGAGIDKALAVSVAKVDALKRGADAAIAGSIEAQRFDVEDDARKALSTPGVQPHLVAWRKSQALGKLGALESSEIDRKAREAALRESSKKGGGGGGGASKEDSAQKALEAYRQLVATYDEVEAKTLKVEAARKTLTEAERLGVITSQQSDEALKEYTKTLGDAKSPMLDLANTASQSLSQAFMAIVDGSKSASDAFGDMARTIIKQAFEMAVINPIINSIFGGVKGFSLLPSFFADGGVFSGGAVDKKFANGGVVGGPTTFPMAGGKTGLMGEAGPEAIMPLKRGKNGKLGVSAEGGGSQNVTVVQNFNFQANGDESVKKIIAQAAPSISAMAQKGMMDQRRRGGAMKSTFG